MDLVSNLLPARLGDPQWRYGAVGLGAGFLLTPLLGFVMLAAAAAVLRHGTVLRVTGIVNLTVAVLLVIAVVFFVLDALQIRGSVPSEARTTFDIGVVKALIKNLTGASALAWLGIASRKVGKDMPRKGRRDSDPVLVGRKKGG